MCKSQPHTTEKTGLIL